MALLFLLLASFASLVGTSDAAFSYDILSTVFLPYSYEPEIYGFGEDASEQIAFDSERKLIYSIGNTNINVIDVSNVNAPVILHHVTYPGIHVTDVAVCGSYVYTTNVNESDPNNGYLNLYRAYNEVSGTLELVGSVVVGSTPDMVKPVSSCMKALVAVEGEPYDDLVAQTLVDVPGGIGVLTITDTETLEYTMIDFTAFDNQYETLKASGVRYIYRGTDANPNSFSNNIEPEYIEFNSDETKAYITLQENNAIAVFDMATNTITDIYGLGFKDWSKLKMDASDNQEINLQSYPVYGIYQPRAIKQLYHGGVSYLVTANEGDSKDYDYFSEEKRVNQLTLSSNFGSDEEIMALQSNDSLGRLLVTTIDGLNDNGTAYDALYTFGARSFSIWKASDLSLVYDSGDELGRKTAEIKPELFNADGEALLTLAQTVDTRSDDKGVEPASLAVGVVDDVEVILVGSERPGSVAVYLLPASSSTIRPVFETFIYDIPTTGDATWQSLYDNRKASMIDPEDILFVAADESPNGKPLVFISGSTSGTVSIVQLTITNDSKNAARATTTTLGVVISFLAMVYIRWIL